MSDVGSSDNRPEAIHHDEVDERRLDPRLLIPEIIPGEQTLDDVFPDLAARRPHPRIAEARRAAILARIEEARRAEESGRDTYSP